MTWNIFQVIQWCTQHKDDPPPPEDDENKEKRTDDIPVWDQEFLKVDQGTLFELILVCLELLFILKQILIKELFFFDQIWPNLLQYLDCVHLNLKYGFQEYLKDISIQPCYG